MATTDQLTAWLAAAEQAQQDLMTGVRAVSIASASGKSVTYSTTNAGQLAAYIESLKRQLGLSTVKPLRFKIG